MQLWSNSATVAPPCRVPNRPVVPWPLRPGPGSGSRPGVVWSMLTCLRCAATRSWPSGLTSSLIHRKFRFVRRHLLSCAACCLLYCASWRMLSCARSSHVVLRCLAEGRADVRAPFAFPNQPRFVFGVQVKARTAHAQPSWAARGRLSVRACVVSVVCPAHCAAEQNLPQHRRRPLGLPQQGRGVRGE